MMHVVAFISMPGLLISREFDHAEFPRIGDSITIDGETFEVVAIDQIDHDTIAIEVGCAIPWACDQWGRLEFTPGTEYDPITVIKELCL